MTPKVYLMDTAGKDQKGRGLAEGFEMLCSSLSWGRQDKIRQFRFPQGKLLSLGAGLLLDYGLRQYGLREKDVAVAFKENGKPYLTDYPEICFNLSHSGTMAMASFAGREVGCDIEQVGDPDFRVARRFFAPGEKEALNRIPGPKGRAECFYRFWTLKESFLKVTGQGVRMPLDGFCIHMGPPVQVEVEGAFLDYGFWEFALPGYRASLCIQGAGGQGRLSPVWDVVTLSAIESRFDD
ncbi:MAG: 4'-phosphopantetheinyl transferase superfamily protein [Lachnospiraceae bacterium]|nr:4'-phosphopantetheinyl transferase superfamily protein [Lachnospiraceae bacterium]